MTKEKQFMMFENEIQKYPILSLKEETELVKRMHRGDEEARQRLICCNLRHVISAAKVCVHDWKHLSDAISIGNEAICKVAHKFDASKGNRVSTFVVTCVQNAIRTELPNVTSNVCIPYEQRRLGNMVKKAQSDFVAKCGYEPDAAVLAAITNLSEKRVRELLHMEFNRESIDERRPSQDKNVYKAYNGKANMGEQYNEPRNIFSDIADKRSRKTETERGISMALGTLPKRIREIVEMRFGLGNEKGLTNQEIGEKIGLSAEGVRKIVIKSIAQIQRNRTIMEELRA